MICKYVLSDLFFPLYFLKIFKQNDKIYFVKVSDYFMKMSKIN